MSSFYCFSLFRRNAACLRIAFGFGFYKFEFYFLSCFVFALEVVWCAQVVLVTALSAVGGFGGPPRDR